MAGKQTISDLLLEQYSLRELSPAQEKRVREALEDNDILRARLAGITESNREILSAYPAERVVPAIRERLLREGGTRRKRPQPVLWVLPVAAMVVLLLSFFVVRERAGMDETRLKGLTPHLSVFRKTPAGAEELRSGALARRGDVLQLSYVAGDAKFGAIVSVDGRGHVTWHLPAGYAGGAGSAPGLDPKGQVVLPSAYELDDAPAFERFFLVFASAPFNLGDVDRAARALAARTATAGQDPLGLPGGLGQFSLVVKK